MNVTTQTTIKAATVAKAAKAKGNPKMNPAFNRAAYLKEHGDTPQNRDMWAAAQLDAKAEQAVKSAALGYRPMFLAHQVRDHASFVSFIAQGEGKAAMAAIVAALAGKYGKRYADLEPAQSATVRKQKARIIEYMGFSKEKPALAGKAKGGAAGAATGGSSLATKSAPSELDSAGHIAGMVGRLYAFIAGLKPAYEKPTSAKASRDAATYNDALAAIEALAKRFNVPAK